MWMIMRVTVVGVIVFMSMMMPFSVSPVRHVEKQEDDRNECDQSGIVWRSGHQQPRS